MSVLALHDRKFCLIFRHIDNLKHFVFRECQSLFDLATKPCSVVFNAYRHGQLKKNISSPLRYIETPFSKYAVLYRDDSYFNGGEDYLTFSGCTVNIGNGMNPKSGGV